MRKIEGQPSEEIYLRPGQMAIVIDHIDEKVRFAFYDSLSIKYFLDDGPLRDHPYKYFCTRAKVFIYESIPEFLFNTDFWIIDRLGSKNLHYVFNLILDQLKFLAIEKDFHERTTGNTRL